MSPTARWNGVSGESKGSRLYDKENLLWQSGLVGSDFIVCRLMCMKFCILISLVLVFIFGLYALCGDILWTVKVSEETVPSVFARLVREGYELPMTIVSVLLLSRVMGALAKKNWDFFFATWKKRWAMFGICLAWRIDFVGSHCVGGAFM